MPEERELLKLSAPLARELAASHCRRDPATGESCAWIHGLWQYLRVLGLASTPAQHVDFYRGAFDAIPATASAPRVLISGAADYGMLACALAAFRGRGIEPEITVVDRCETPLALNRWYAERVSCKIATICADMTAFSGERVYDAVCTHSFFSELAPEERSAAVAAWRRLLRPGGLVVTANRVRPEGGAVPVGFAPEQARAFGATVLRLAQSMRERLQVDPEDLARCAETYAGRRRAYPLRSREEIVQLFAGADFRMDRLEFTSANAGAAVGPTTPSGAQYAYIVASRP